MRRQARIDTDDGGLDALLDTMTNVVGILVLVLIVAQLGVADVVSRVINQSQVDQQMIDDAKRQLVQKQIERRELQQILFEPLSIDFEQQQEELARKKELLERRKRLLSEKQQIQNQYAIKIEQDKQQAEQNQLELAETEQQRQQLETLISTSLQRKAQLEAALADTPTAEPPAAVEVSIPNPRPAPEGAQRLMLICEDNLLYPVNFEFFRKRAEEHAKQILSRFNLLRDPAAGIDPQEFARHYQRLKDQDDFFDVEYYVQNDQYPRIRFLPRKNRGGTVKQLASRRPRIQRMYVDGIDGNKYYARFYVLPDSYEVYTVARRAFGNAQIMAGWEPQNQDWRLTASVPGGIVLGPPPPPPKSAPPSPPSTSPPKQPPPPPNLID